MNEIYPRWVAATGRTTGGAQRGAVARCNHSRPEERTPARPGRGARAAAQEV